MYIMQNKTVYGDGGIEVSTLADSPLVERNGLFWVKGKDNSCMFELGFSEEEIKQLKASAFIDE